MANPYEAASAYQHRVFGALIERQFEIAETLEAGPYGDEEAARWGAKEARKLENCCRSATVCGDEVVGDIGISEQCCKSRICMRCGRRRAKRHVARAAAVIRGMDAPRFITLTLKHSHQTLQNQINRLRQSFTKLRKHPAWRERVTGGVYVIEIKISETDGLWHPHIHAVIDGAFFPRPLLQHLWQEATTDSFKVDIRKVNSASQAAKYLASYVAKTSDGSSLPNSAIVEWARAVKSLRMMSAFGAMRAIRLELPQLKRSAGFTPFADAEALANLALEGFRPAARYLDEVELVDRGPLPIEAPPISEADAARARKLIRDADWILFDGNRWLRKKSPPARAIPARKQEEITA